MSNGQWDIKELTAAMASHKKEEELLAMQQDKPSAPGRFNRSGRKAFAPPEL